MLSVAVLQAALAVGAVRDGQAPTATRNHRETFPQIKPDNLEGSSQDNYCEFRGPSDGAVYGKERTSFSSSEDGGRLPERFGHSPEERREPGERGAGERMAEHSLRKWEMEARLPEEPPRGEHVAGKGASERDRQPTYGRGFYHDSRRSLELMPILQESDAPQNQNGSAPVGSRQAEERGGDRITLFKEPTSAPTISNPNPLEEEEGEKPVTARHALARHAVSTASEVPQTFEVLNAVVAEGQQTARNQLPAARTSRQKMVMSDGMTGAGGTVADPLSERYLGGLLKGHGSVVAREAITIVDSPTSAVAQLPLPMKDNDGKEAGDVLSPAPFHGGSPSVLPSSVLPIISKGSEGSTHRAAADTSMPLAEDEAVPGVEAQAAEQRVLFFPPFTQCGSGHDHGITSHAAGTSSGGGRYPRHCIERITAAAASMISTGVSHDRVSSRDSADASSRRRDDRRLRKERTHPGLSDAEESYRRPEGTINAESASEGRCDSEKRRGGGSGLVTDTDIVMNLEAVGCTATVFEELLEPRVVAVYSRCEIWPGC